MDNDENKHLLSTYCMYLLNTLRGRCYQVKHEETGSSQNCRLRQPSLASWWEHLSLGVGNSSPTQNGRKRAASHCLSANSSLPLSWAPREAAHQCWGSAEAQHPLPSEKACSLTHVGESAVACERPRAAGNRRRRSCGQCLQARMLGIRQRTAPST